MAHTGRPRSPSPGGRTRRATPKATAAPAPQQQQQSQTVQQAAPAQQSAASGQQDAQQQPKGQQPKFGGLKQLWCPFYLKGKCSKGDACPLPHVDATAKQAIQSAIQKGRASLGFRTEQ